jgi:hypothetical protein
MGDRRIAAPIAAALLLASAALSYAAAWQRWHGICGWGDASRSGCVERQDFLYDALWPTAPWQPIGMMAQCLGLGQLLLAVALLVLPAALGRRPSRVQWLLLSVAAFVLTYLGVGTLFAGLRGYPLDSAGFVGVDSGLTGVVGLVWYFGLPVLYPLALFTKDADGRRAGLRGGLVAWMLFMAAPIFQWGWAGMFAGGDVPDVSPWYEAAVVPFLVIAALALKPWSLRSPQATVATSPHPVPAIR